MDDRPDVSNADDTQQPTSVVIDLRDGADFEERLAEIEAMLDLLGIPS